VRIGEVRILRIYLRKIRKVSTDSVGAGGNVRLLRSLAVESPADRFLLLPTEHPEVVRSSTKLQATILSLPEATTQLSGNGRVNQPL
jgi:hypothetical protein